MAGQRSLTAVYPSLHSWWTTQERGLILQHIWRVCFPVGNILRYEGCTCWERHGLTPSMATSDYRGAAPYRISRFVFLGRFLLCSWPMCRAAPTQSPGKTTLTQEHTVPLPSVLLPGHRKLLLLAAGKLHVKRHVGPRPASIGAEVRFHE